MGTCLFFIDLSHRSLQSLVAAGYQFHWDSILIIILRILYQLEMLMVVNHIIKDLIKHIFP
jgi:hypothetical protein